MNLYNFDSIMQKYRVIVTGVSRGLGKDLLRIILKNNPQYEVIGTARTQIQQIQQNIDTQFPNNFARILNLDLEKKQSIHEFVRSLKQKKFQFDCLINNAAVGADDGSKVPTPEIAQKTFTANIIGTSLLTEELIPLLRQNGRIINVSSKMGALRYHGKQIIEKYQNQKISLQQIIADTHQYIQGCKKGDVGQYYKSAYGTSKMMLNAWSRYILRKKLKNGQVAIAMSPGHCQTDMSLPGAIRTSEEGARSIYACIKNGESFDIFYHTDQESDYMNCGPITK